MANKYIIFFDMASPPMLFRFDSATSQRGKIGFYVAAARRANTTHETALIAADVISAPRFSSRRPLTLSISIGSTAMPRWRDYLSQQRHVGAVFLKMSIIPASESHNVSFIASQPSNRAISSALVVSIEQQATKRLTAR